LVMLDAQLSDLPDWSEPQWPEYFLHLRTLVVAAHLSEEQGQKVLARGAYGYAHAHLPIANLDRVLSSIEAGSIWMGRNLLQRLLQDIDQRLVENTERKWAQKLSLREA